MARRVQVSLRDHTVTVWLDDGATVVVPVGIGRPETPTPAGRWRVLECRQEVMDGIAVDVLVLDAPGHVCLRGHPDLASLGRACSGG